MTEKKRPERRASRRNGCSVAVYDTNVLRIVGGSLREEEYWSSCDGAREMRSHRYENEGSLSYNRGEFGTYSTKK